MLMDHAGLYFDADTGGAGGGSEAGSDDVQTLQNRVAELENQVSSLQGQLAEQRNIQAGLDRTVSQKDAKITSLTEQVNRYKSIAESDTTALEEIQGEREALAERVSELEGTESELETLQQTHNRWRLLMENHPELSYLASNDAMPAAETDEEFVQKLDRIAGVAGSAAEGKAKEMLDGSRPSTQPPGGQGGEDPSALRKEAFRLYEAGKADEGRVAMDKYYAALEAQASTD